MSDLDLPCGACLIENDDSVLVRSLEGRTIQRAIWFDASPDCDWEAHHHTCRLLLDDGRVIEFGGYGYDAWGGTVTDNPVCERCDGLRHV